jgi:hypothetical protein
LGKLEENRRLGTGGCRLEDDIETDFHAIILDVNSIALP